MQNTNRGLIKIFLIIVIGIILLAAFNVDVQGFFHKPAVEKITTTLWQVFHTIWAIVGPYLLKAWELMIQYIWTPVTNRLNLTTEVATSTGVSL